MKQKRFCKSLSLLLSLLFLLFAFSACTVKDSEQNDPSQDTQKEDPADTEKEEPPTRSMRFANVLLNGTSLSQYTLVNANAKSQALQTWLDDVAGVTTAGSGEFTIVLEEDKSFLMNEIQVQISDKKVILVSSAYCETYQAMTEYFENQVIQNENGAVKLSQSKQKWEIENPVNIPAYNADPIRSLYCTAAVDKDESAYQDGDYLLFCCSLYANEKLASCAKFVWNAVLLPNSGSQETAGSGQQTGGQGKFTVKIPVKKSGTLLITVTPKDSNGNDILQQPYQFGVNINAGTPRKDPNAENSFWHYSVVGNPVVYAVGEEYQIFVPSNGGETMWVEVNGKCYYDDSNGVLKSSTFMHKMTVPMSELDQAKTYRIYSSKVVVRKAYNSELQPPTFKTYSFTPISQTSYNIYQIADAHGMKDKIIEAAEKFRTEKGSLDLLVLNGDLISTSENLSVYNLIYQLAWEITGGSVPVIFSRGNHDLRGLVAEKLSEYTPVSATGKSYYTVRLGNLWAMVLDAGEDKSDDHPEYGGTVACHQFRLQETEFIKSVIANKANEYEAPGVEHVMIICHYYFHWNRYKVESEIYDEWVVLINQIQPDLALEGHYHEFFIHYPGDKLTFADGTSKIAEMNFPAVIGSKVNEGSYFAGCGLCISGKKITVVFNDNTTVLQEKELINAQGNLVR